MSEAGDGLRFSDHLVVLRGGGDLATGVAWRLRPAGFPIVVCELARPLAIRRQVAVATAVNEGSVDIEGMTATMAAAPGEARTVARTGDVAVIVSPTLPDLAPSVVVDARLAKRGGDTAITDAPLVIGLGPGFTVGVDCHAVVETARGHHLGRAIWSGSAAPDTGTPGVIGGRSAERVVRAPRAGPVEWTREIGDLVVVGQPLGAVGGQPVDAPLDGVVRGLIAPGSVASEGQKIGDVDPRSDPEACYEISDKSLAVGGGVLEAVLSWLNRAS